MAVAAGAVGLEAPRAGASGAPPASYLVKARNADGGYGVSPGSKSSPEMTGWAMLGLEAAGRNPLDLGKRGATPVSYLRKHASKIVSTGDLERTILALDGAGVSPRSFDGRDLVARLHHRRRHDGSYGGQVNLTAFGLLAMRASGKPVRDLRRSRRWLQRARNTDGGWGFQPGVASDPDSTGAALQGLAAAGAGTNALRKGVRYLSREQRHDGGWPLAGSGPSNTQSTAWAVQGLIAAGENPAATRAGGHSGLDYLAARRASNGHYRYSRSSDQTPVWVTGQAVMAVERKALPLGAVAREQPSGGGDGGDGGATPSGGAPSGGASPTVPHSVAAAPTNATSGGVPPIVNAATANALPANGKTDKKKGQKGQVNGATPAPAPPGSHIAPGSPFGPPPKGALDTSPETKGNPPPALEAADGGSDGTPPWAYAAGGLALVALLGAGGVWWYRSGGWVPPRPHFR